MVADLTSLRETFSPGEDRGPGGVKTVAVIAAAITRLGLAHQEARVLWEENASGVPVQTWRQFLSEAKIVTLIDPATAAKDLTSELAKFASRGGMLFGVAGGVAAELSRWRRHIADPGGWTGGTSEPRPAR